MKKKTLVTVLALVLIFAVAVGGAVAWLVAQTKPVVNTFTVGDINITLTETDAVLNKDETAFERSDFKMIPGNTIAKDPKVTVKADSEACWLFVKVEKSANFDNFLTYSMATGWEQLKDKDGNAVAGVYYRAVVASTADTAFSVLAGDTVTVKGEVTKTDLNGLTAATYPTLTFTAYAVQKDNIADAATAWAKIS